MGLQKNPGIKGQSAPTTPVGRVAQGATESGIQSLGSAESPKQVSWIPGVEKPKVTAAGEGAEQRSRRHPRASPALPSSARKQGWPFGHRALRSAAPTCRLHAGPPRHGNAPAPPTPAGTRSSAAYGGREETTNREGTRRTTTPRRQRALKGRGGAMSR